MIEPDGLRNLGSLPEAIQGLTAAWRVGTSSRVLAQQLTVQLQRNPKPLSPNP